MGHYEILELSPKATTEEIKKAYRRLVKAFHPDSQTSQASHERIVALNAAYEVLSDPKKRHQYDQNHSPGIAREKRNQRATQRGRTYQNQARETDHSISVWLNQVYIPIATQIRVWYQAGEMAIDTLAADIFDNELMTEFEVFLDEFDNQLQMVQKQVRAYPNPQSLAKAAAYLYYSLNHIEDALEEFRLFSQGYDEVCLHNGLELFRLTEELLQDADLTIEQIIR